LGRSPLCFVAVAVVTVVAASVPVGSGSADASEVSVREGVSAADGLDADGP
jgi:hypothetical protein